MFLVLRLELALGLGQRQQVLELEEGEKLVLSIDSVDPRPRTRLANGPSSLDR
jgi:hypothetical protein